MKYLKYVLLGMLLGCVLTKSELISWYRWQEMFRFESFQLYGIMLTAVLFGALGIAMLKKMKAKDIEGQPILFVDKPRRFYQYALGGLIFGLGLSLAGCPGAHYALMGHGYVSVVIVFVSALAGTFLYGLLKNHLPH